MRQSTMKFTLASMWLANLVFQASTLEYSRNSESMGMKALTISVVFMVSGLVVMNIREGFLALTKEAKEADEINKNPVAKEARRDN